MPADSKIWLQLPAVNELVISCWEVISKFLVDSFHFLVDSKLSQPQQQHNLNTVVGLNMKMTVQTPPRTAPPHKYNVMNKNKQGNNNNVYNYNNNINSL